MPNEQVWISPNHRQSYLNVPSIERKINVFKSQVSGWTFDHATSLTAANYARRERAGFAILMLCAAYVETLEGCYRGRPSRSGEARTYFVCGFRKVFSEATADVAQAAPGADAERWIENACAAVYAEVRCGLYHRMSTARRVIISHAGEAIRFEFDAAGQVTLMEIAPRRFLSKVKAHFRRFIEELRDPARLDLRASFEQYFGGRSFGGKRPVPTMPPGGARSTF
jgi:hypothetical protein